MNNCILRKCLIHYKIVSYKTYYKTTKVEHLPTTLMFPKNISAITFPSLVLSLAHLCRWSLWKLSDLTTPWELLIACTHFTVWYRHSVNDTKQISNMQRCHNGDSHWDNIFFFAVYILKRLAFHRKIAKGSFIIFRRSTRSACSWPPSSPPQSVHYKCRLLWLYKYVPTIASRLQQF